MCPTDISSIKHASVEGVEFGSLPLRLGSFPRKRESSLAPDADFSETTAYSVEASEGLLDACLRSTGMIKLRIHQ